MGLFGKPPENKPADPIHPPRPAAPPPAPPREAPHAAAPPAAPRPNPAAVGSCVVGPSITIKGEILGDEDVVVDGTVEGQIRIGRELRVGPSGKVKASVTAQSIVVSGEMMGDCEASSRVEIHASGRLTGNIRAPKIVIAEGAMFRGNSDMSGRRDPHKDKVAVS